MPNYVYVVELDPVVMENSSWKKENPDQRSDKCYYVGQSSHSPACRLKQHTTKHSDPCTCECDKKPGEEVRPAVVGRARFVKDHARGLRPELYSHLNPIESEAKAKEAERALAERLKNAEHGAWFG